MTSIPANRLVNVVPSVLGAGSQELVLNGVFLTHDLSLPLGTVVSFPDATAVANFFGAESDEALLANNYFRGFEGATIIPSALLMASYNDRDANAFLRSASLSSVTLAHLQALSGNLIVVIDGRTVTSAAINLASATSFTNAAALISAGVQTVGSIFSGVASLASTVLTVESVAAGRLHTGDPVLLDGATTTVIVSQTSGSPGGVGVYVVTVGGSLSSVSATVTSTAVVTYDSLRHAFVITSPTSGANSTIGFATGTLAIPLFLTLATGAVTSQGAAEASPVAFMTAFVQVTQNWATFMTVWEPDTDTKVEFASWVTGTEDRFTYVAWDTDVGPTASQDDEASFGRVTMDYNGVCPVWGLSDKAAFICGMLAAINFSQPNGRITAAYKQQAGLTADVTDATVADNLLANGYNFYGDYAASNTRFQFLQNGQVSGTWNWLDSYVNQIKLNSDLQVAFLDLLTSTPSIPYTQRGYNLYRLAASDPINAAINFGSIQPGVELSARQVAEIDSEAGQAGVGRAVAVLGFFLQIKSASADIRAVRGSPPMTLWYADGGSIQKVDLASINVQ